MTDVNNITINAIADEIHENAKAHGWHEDALYDHLIKTVANIHGEVSEFWEAYRNGDLDSQCDKEVELTCSDEELADIVIRTLDTMKRMGKNPAKIILAKHKYNIARSYRHGGKIA